MLSSTTTEQLQTTLGTGSYEFVFDCGYTKPLTQATVDDKKDIVHTVWLHFGLFQPHAELAQLRNGLYQTLQFEGLAFYIQVKCGIF